MDLDFSFAREEVNKLALDIVVVLGLPFVLAIILGYVLKMLNVPIRAVGPLASVVFLIGVFQMFKYYVG
ncbi:hypothetical protein EQV77_00850 [Halobacillus fulvus]|nr:hypothetical protein EQV77_00850 [Halobacillus fulvus]